MEQLSPDLNWVTRHEEAIYKTVVIFVVVLHMKFAGLTTVIWVGVGFYSLHSGRWFLSWIHFELHHLRAL